MYEDDEDCHDYDEDDIDSSEDDEIRLIDIAGIVIGALVFTLYVLYYTSSVVQEAVK